VTERFVMRPKAREDGHDMAILVKDGALVVIDRLSRRYRFPLSDPNGPKRVQGYYRPSNPGNGRERWTVVDQDGKAFLDVDERDWNSSDFRRLAAVAKLELDPEEGESTTLTAPPRRQDFIDLTELRGSTWKWILIGLVVPVLTVIAVKGLFSGSPWIWPTLFVGLGAWSLSVDVRDALDAQRNRAYLPTDEGGMGLKPGEARPRSDLGRALADRKVPKRAVLLAAFALIPPVLTMLR
jgi:hypothetical protein